MGVYIYIERQNNNMSCHNNNNNCGHQKSISSLLVMDDEISLVKSASYWLKTWKASGFAGDQSHQHRT